MIKQYTPKIKELEVLLPQIEILGRDYDFISKTVDMMLLSQNPRPIARSIGNYLENQLYSVVYARKECRAAVFNLKRIVQAFKEIADEPPIKPRKVA